MRASVAVRLTELESLLSAAKARVGYLRSYDGARNPFASLAETAALNDFLKRSQALIDKLSRHFSAQMRRKGASK